MTLDEVTVVGAESEENRIDVLAKADELVLVLRRRDREVELQAGRIEEPCVEHAFDTLVRHLTEVLVAAGRA